MSDDPTIIGGATPGDRGVPSPSDVPTVVGGPPPQAVPVPRGLRFDEGATIGHFTITRMLGEGGFGVVYEAEQREPVRRTVALKLVKPGMDSSEVLARFEAERQALARMEHPCVAKVLDAGITEDHRPYFAMEFVRGEPIGAFADRERLSVRQRLVLFIRVAEAIQHAHVKGVVHRDLKPANILCTRTESGLFPKIIDFGIAKAMGERLGNQEIRTIGGMMIGTPDYMSPEQAQGGDVDTRSDVYALGATLYELVSGLLPFDPKALRGKGFAEMQRILSEETPPRPSARYGDLLQSDPARADAIAAARAASPPALRAALRDDIDWICLKCLEKDRERRYGSAGELAADIRRHLDRLPVSAGPPSRRYVFRKFVSRHRWGVGAASVGAVLVVASAITFAVLYRTAEEQRRRATDTLDAFQQSIVAIDPERGKGRADLNAIDFLSLVEGNLDSRLDRQPDVLASLQTTMGLARLAMSDNEGARRLLDRALAERREAARRDPTAANRRALGEALHNQGRVLYALREFEGAFQSYSEALAVRRGVAGGRPTPEVAMTLQHLAATERQRRRVDEAAALYDASIDMWTQIDGAGLDWARAINNRATLREQLGRLDEAERDFRLAVEIASANMPEDDVQLARMLTNLGRALSRNGKHDEAIPVLERSLAIKQKRLGPDDPQTKKGELELAEAQSARAGAAPPP
jgi:non-specific serine/threonine protein kinase/serine/threonine-protein kinase